MPWRARLGSAEGSLGLLVSAGRRQTALFPGGALQEGQFGNRKCLLCMCMASWKSQKTHAPLRVAAV